MRGQLTFRITPDQQIRIEADIVEMTEFDVLRVATALTEQAFKLQMSLVKRAVDQAKAKQVIQDASAEAFKKQVDENSK